MQRTPPPARRGRVPDEVADMKEIDENEDDGPKKPTEEPKPTTAIRRKRNRGKGKETNPLSGTLPLTTCFPISKTCIAFSPKWGWFLPPPFAVNVGFRGTIYCPPNC